MKERSRGGGQWGAICHVLGVTSAFGPDRVTRSYRSVWAEEERALRFERMVSGGWQCQGAVLWDEERSRERHGYLGWGGLWGGVWVLGSGFVPKSKLQVLPVEKECSLGLGGPRKSSSPTFCNLLGPLGLICPMSHSKQGGRGARVSVFAAELVGDSTEQKGCRGASPRLLLLSLGSLAASAMARMPLQTHGHLSIAGTGLC